MGSLDPDVFDQDNWFPIGFPLFPALCALWSLGGLGQIAVQGEGTRSPRLAQV